MPAQSEAQRRLLYAKFGKAWVERHGFNNEGKLPEHVAQAKGAAKALSDQTDRSNIHMMGGHSKGKRGNMTMMDSYMHAPRGGDGSKK